MTLAGPRRAPGPRLRPQLGLFSITVSGVGIVLGAGIYVLVGEAAGEAGNLVWLSFLLAAFVAAATGLSFAELSAMLPESGASSAYAREAFGPRMGFLTGWLTLTVNVTGAAAVALGFGGYLESLLGWDGQLLAVAAVVVSAFIVYLGIRETVAFAAVFALAEAAGLAFVIIVGLPDVGSVPLLEGQGGVAGVLTAAALVFFAFQGFEGIAALAEEARDAARTIPRAILLSIGITSVIYVLVSIVAVSVVPWDELAATNAPLALVVTVASSERMGDALSLLALLATFNTVLLLLATGARITYGMGNRRLLPAAVALVSDRGTPWVATLLVSGVALVFVGAGDIGYVAQVTNFAIFALFVAVNASLLRLRFTQSGRPRPFLLRGAVGRVPVMPLLASAGILLFAAFMDGGAAIAGTIALLIGVGLSFVIPQRIGSDTPEGTPA